MNLKACKNNMGKEHALCDSPLRALKFTFMLLCKSKVHLEVFEWCLICAQNTCATFTDLSRKFGAIHS